MPGFWLLTAGFFVCGFHVTFIATHLPAYLTDAGLSPAAGATAAPHRRSGLASAGQPPCNSPLKRMT